jgi:Domain of unknown function (DUF4166)
MENPAMKVQHWFGDQFAELHPLLRNLHLHGGALSGAVQIELGRGLGKWLGAAIARKFSIPTSAGLHPFSVRIFHAEDGLHWHRRFDGQTEMKSLFVPQGRIQDGCWTESTGPVRLALTVDIREGGWYWRCVKTWVHGVRVPLWLLPRTTAYKRIEDGRYRFYVGFSLPLVGTVLSYGGLLDTTVADERK